MIGFELGRVAADDLQLRGAILQHALDNVREEVFGEFQQAVEIQKATSGSIIQNSVRWRRVLDFSARKVGPKL